MATKHQVSKAQQQNNALINLYDFLVTYIAEHGYAPNIRQIVQNLGCARQTAVNYLKQLQAMGWIERPYWRHGAIKLTRPTETGLTPDDLQELIQHGEKKPAKIRWFKQ